MVAVQLIIGTLMLSVGIYVLFTQQTQTPAKNVKEELIRTSSAFLMLLGIFFMFSALKEVGLEKIGLAGALIMGFALLFIDFRRRGSKVFRAFFQALIVIVIILAGLYFFNKYVFAKLGVGRF